MWAPDGISRNVRKSDSLFNDKSSSAFSLTAPLCTDEADLVFRIGPCIRPTTAVDTLRLHSQSCSMGVDCPAFTIDKNPPMNYSAGPIECLFARLEPALVQARNSKAKLCGRSH